ncbi:hypothetical protein ACN47E_005190 [Coniothyrium glycines]
MSTIDDGIARLRADLGVRADDLKYAPLSDVSTMDQDHEPAAVSFKIEFGYTRDKYDQGKRRQVWLLLIPSPKSGRMEIRFHSHDEIDDHEAQYNPENICKSIKDCARAFNHTKIRSRAKYMALAKYYFLMKLAEIGNEDDLHKIRSGFVMSKSSVDELGSVCRDFKEEATRVSNLPASSQVALAHSSDGPDSDLSDEPAEGFDVEEALVREDTLGAKDEQGPTELTGEQIHISTAETKKEVATSALIELDDAEELLVTEVASIEDEISALIRRRKVLDEEVKNIETRRKNVLEDYGRTDAYSLGREVERMRSVKRPRTE